MGTRGVVCGFREKCRETVILTSESHACRLSWVVMCLFTLPQSPPTLPLYCQVLELRTSCVPSKHSATGH